MTARIDRVWPDPAQHLDDEELTLSARSTQPCVRVNFVTSIDGAATRDGRSGGLGDAADKRLFELLRRACDVVLVGAGTVRTEGYGAMRVSDASARWRVAAGLPPHPVFAIVSGHLDLDPASPIFTDAPVRPIVMTSDGATGVREFASVADVVRAGPTHVDVGQMLEVLHSRGLTQVLCEGGPTLFGSLIAAAAVDELYLTVAPTLEAGDARRITSGPAAPLDMGLSRILRSGDTLLLRYSMKGVQAARSSASTIP